MSNRVNTFVLLVAVTALSFPAPGASKKRLAGEETTGTITAVLWRNPVDIASRNLFYGPGGRRDEPHGPFTFIKEDLKGTNPKFVVRDRDGVKWTVKLGPEARPETAAARLIWAAGYFTNEDYLAPVLRVSNMPSHLARGRNLVARDGSMRNVRLKRSVAGLKKIGDWPWRHGPFAGTRELNGLRVMMALINNWDLKDDNNAVYEARGDRRSGGVTRIYMVTDLGASFGTTGSSRTAPISKGNLRSYSRSKFISKATPQYIDFNLPSRPSPFSLSNLLYYFDWIRIRWIGKRVPRDDVRWIAHVLERLSPAQVGDAFRAAGYSPQEVEQFTSVFERRIAALNEL